MLTAILVYIIFIGVLSVGIAALGFLGYAGYKCVANKTTSHGTRACLDW